MLDLASPPRAQTLRDHALALVPLLVVLALSSPRPAGAQPQQVDDAAPTQDLFEQADAIAEEVSALRGLELKAPLRRDVRTREQLRAFLIEAIQEDFTPAQIEGESIAYKALGLLPQGFAYEAFVIDLLTAQIAGFYDPEVKQLYIMTGLAAPTQVPTMAHEIFHALQDQHYDLLAMQRPFEAHAQGDFALARSALFEGDAMVLMIDHTLHALGELPQAASAKRPAITTIASDPRFVEATRELSLSTLSVIERMLGGEPGDSAELQGSAINQAPPVIKEAMLFPYLAGFRFTLLAFQELGSWPAFYERLYRDAPVSTEQILHPERYFERDAPVLLSCSPEAPQGALKVYDNVLGEFQMHLLLRQHLRVDRPHGAPPDDLDLDRAVEGWGGDRLFAYASPDVPTVTVHLSSWDRVQDAKEYYDALTIALTTRHFGAISRAQSIAAGFGEATYLVTAAAAAADAKASAPPASLLYIERWGDTVLHIEGLPAPAPSAPLSAAYAPLKRLRDSTYGTLEREDLYEVMSSLLEADAAPSPSDVASP